MCIWIHTYIYICLYVSLLVLYFTSLQVALFLQKNPGRRKTLCQPNTVNAKHIWLISVHLPQRQDWWELGSQTAPLENVECAWLMRSWQSRMEEPYDSWPAPLMSSTHALFKRQIGLAMIWKPFISAGCSWTLWKRSQSAKMFYNSTLFLSF